MSSFRALVARDLAIALREGGRLGTSIGFYAIVVAFVPLGIGPDLELLARVAPGVLWIGLLLASLLSLGRLFADDAADASLEVLAAGPTSMEVIVIAKCLVHWLTAVVPLALATPALALMLNVPPDAYPALLLTLLAGTPTVSLIGAIGAALTLHARRGGLLIALLVLPLYIPTMIFAIGATGTATGPQGSVLSSLALLLALSLAALVLAPLAAAAALRVQME